MHPRYLVRAVVASLLLAAAAPVAAQQTEGGAAEPLGSEGESPPPADETFDEAVWRWLMNELDPAEQDEFVAYYAALDEQQRAALLDMTVMLPEGDRGTFAIALLRMDAARSSALLGLLDFLGSGARGRLAQEVTDRWPRRWDVLGDYAAAAPFDEIAWSLFVAGERSSCPDPAYPHAGSAAPLDQAASAADGDAEQAPVIGCSDATAAFMYSWNTEWVRVVSGNPVREGHAPWQAQIIRSEQGLALWQTPRLRRAEMETYGEYLPDWESRHICGGTYIGGGWVITAAHCLEGWNFADLQELMRVRLGATSAETGGQEYRIAGAVVHAAYRGRSTDWQHDIALLRLAGTVSPAGLRTASIPRGPNRDAAIRTPLMLTGWGITGATYNATAQRDRNGRLQRYSQVLQQGDLYLRNPSTCGDSGQLNGVTIRAGQLCAGATGGVDACRGDSGGPLVLPRGSGQELIGIVSYGAGCGLADTAKIFTDVGYYSEWIRAAQRQPHQGRRAAFACDLEGFAPC